MENGPTAQIIHEAPRDREDRIFWAEVQSYFAIGSGEPDPETELWGATVGDGFNRNSSERFG